MQHFVIIITLLFVYSCKESPSTLSKINAKQLPVDSLLVEVDSIDSFIAPYRDRINLVLDSALAYAPQVLTKTDGKYNTSAGNLMADVILTQANSVFKMRTGKEVDFALLNHGGIRATISKGAVSARTAYEVMPFENSIVVVELNGASVLRLVDYLIQSNRAHPIAGMQIVLNKDETLKSLKIQGKPFNKNTNYFVASSNYLVSGGDNMGFFKEMLSSHDTDYLIRNAMIDYFKKVDTITAEVDNRFYKTK